MKMDIFHQSPRCIFENGTPLHQAAPGQVWRVLLCCPHLPEAAKRLADMGIAPGADIEIIFNEGGRIMLRAGDARMGIDADLARQISVVPPDGPDHRRHRRRCRGHRRGCDPGFYHETEERRKDMPDIISAAEMQSGQQGTVTRVGGERALNRRLRDMGIVPGAAISCRGRAPLGDPIDIGVMGYRLTLRRDEAEQIMVQVRP